MALEEAIKYGKTPQQRIMAGFFVFLVHSSHRCSNGQGSRNFRLTPDALMGEAMLKGKKVWTKWVASRMGFTGTDWAPEWMSELEKCGLPGPDYIVRAPNVGLTAWLRRPAEYRDFARAYHLLLMIYGGESPSSVVEYTPHGCRHVQVTAGAQLAAQGIISEQSLESLSQWERGSKMPKTYDSASCVSELQTRKVIADTLMAGWRPAMDGNLPLPPTPAQQSTTPMTPTTMVRSEAATEKSTATSTSSAPEKIEDQPCFVILLGVDPALSFVILLGVDPALGPCFVNPYGDVPARELRDPPRS